MKIRVKLSRSQVQEMLQDDHRRGSLVRSRSFGKLERGSDQTVCMDESGSFGPEHCMLESTADLKRADRPSRRPQTTESPPSPSSRQPRRSNSIRRIALSRNAINLLAREDEDVGISLVTGETKERRVGRSGSFRNLLAKKQNQKSSSDAVVKPRRSTSRTRSQIRTNSAAKNADQPRSEVNKTPANTNRRSLRAKSFTSAIPRLSLLSKRDSEYDEAALRIRELDALLASKAPGNKNQPKLVIPKTPDAIKTLGKPVHSWDGAIAHVTPGRGQRRRPVQLSLVDCGIYFESEKPASTRAILTAYDEIMKDFADEGSVVDVNTGW